MKERTRTVCSSLWTPHAWWGRPNIAAAVIVAVLGIGFGALTVDAVLMADEGCSHGYWKQQHHCRNWVDYDLDDACCDVFNCSTAASQDALDGKSLQEALGQSGGQLFALGREAVSALLNATSGIAYPVTEADVIQMVNDAIASDDNEEIESVKDQLEQMNNLGCPLSVPSDFDDSGVTGVPDLLFLLASWGPCADCEDCPADLNCDCIVGVPDLLILLGNWG